jgi:multidrug resistance efflux pump
MNTLAIALMTLTITGHQTDSTDVIVVERASIKAIQALEVPALAAGPITEIFVKENELVELGQIMARLDNAEAMLRQAAAAHELDVANVQAREDVKVQTAEAAQLVAKSEVEDSERINQLSPGAVPGTELRRQVLTVQRAASQVKEEKANFESAEFTVGIREQQLGLASHQLGSHQVSAPWPGLVDKVIATKGEWMQEGAPVFTLVQMDRLRVEALVSTDTVAPYDLIDKRVEITIAMANGDEAKVNGKVNYASQVGVSDRDFRVWVEFDNEQILKTSDNKTFFKYRPGMSAKIKIFMDEPAN